MTRLIREGCLDSSQMWQMRDSNPRRRCQLIYSQPPLAARVICRTSKKLPGSLFPATAGKTTLQNFCRRIESGRKRPETRGISGFPEDAPGEFRLEAQSLLLGDLVELHGALEVRVDTVQPGGSVGRRAQDDRSGHCSGRDR